MSIYESAKERAKRYSHHMRATAVLIPLALSIGCAGAGSDVSKNTIAPDQHLVPAVYSEIVKLPYDEQVKEIKKIEEETREFSQRVNQKEIGTFFKINVDEVLKRNQPDGANYGKQDKEREEVMESKRKILDSFLNPDLNSSVSGRKQKKRIQEELNFLGHVEEIYKFNNDSFIYKELESLENRAKSPLSGNEKERFLVDAYKLRKNITTVRDNL